MALPELRVGIVGFGFMGKTQSHAYRSLNYYYDPAPARITLAGVATHSQASWRRAVEEWGFTFGTTDYRELCARGDIDIIHCCAPNSLHKDVLLAALDHGKHVYMDKPLCRSLEEARIMGEAAARHPESVTQIAFQYRFIPAILRAKQLIEAGALGRIYSARVCYLHAGYIDPQRPFSWRLDVEQSGRGGALFDLGAHVVDLTRHLLGEFAEVLHLGETMIKERPLKDDPAVKVPVRVDDVSLMLFRLKNGAVGTLESSRLSTGAQDEVRFEAHGSQGAIRFNLMQPNFLEYYDARPPEAVYGGDRGYRAIECVARYPKPSIYPGPKNTVGWERFHVHSLYHFITHILDGKPSQPDIADGVKTQSVLEAALRSNENRQWTAVEDA
ncbi:MAG: Gfo/Idh/MocA family oxidoreductase [Candidatus Omnitrophica bacterium]|nr:Gfo/Idh/MocA family oxidoreductase [Candidatus Omnitrophota bacterium]